MIVNVKVSIPDGNVYSEEVNNFYGTQVALMQSDTVMNRVSARLQANHTELHPQPVKIDVTVAPKSSIFDLHAVGRPAFTQAYLQAIMDEYTNLKRELIANASSATEFSVQEQLKQMEVELQKAKETVFNFQSTNKEVFLQPSGGNSAADYLLRFEPATCGK